MAGVIVLCSSHSWGGLEQVAAQDARLLAEGGRPVMAIGMRASPFHRALERAKGVRFVALEHEPRNFLDLRLMRELRRGLRAGAQAVFVHQPSLLGSVVPALAGFPRARLWVFRHILSSHRKRGPYHRWLYSRATALFVASEFIRRNVVETHAIPEARVRVLRLGIDLERFDPRRARPARAEWKLASTDWVVGVVGRVDPAKGQAVLLEAVALARPRARDFARWRVLIVGEETRGAPSGELARLRGLARERGLSEQVIFAGFQEDIPAIMATLDLFAMPSREEAFGLVALEALALGCPVVLSEGGSTAEIAEAFGSGAVRLVKPMDSTSLADALLAAELSEGRLGPEKTRNIANFSQAARKLALLDLS